MVYLFILSVNILILFSIRWNNYWLRTHETSRFIDAKPNNGHIALANLSKVSNCKIMFVFHDI